MKKNIFFIAFLLGGSLVYAQNSQYVVKTEQASPELKNKLSLVDQQWFDLYRSEAVDNEVVFTVDNESITIVLYSASKMRSMNLAFNEGLVKKGAIMSGDKANSPRRFNWSIDNSNQVKDLTNY